MNDSSGRGSSMLAGLALAAVGVVVVVVVVVALLGVAGVFLFHRSVSHQNAAVVAERRAVEAAVRRHEEEEMNVIDEANKARESEAAHSEPTSEPLTYVAYRASGPPQIDGRLDDAAWTEAPWSADFVDIEGASKPAPRFRTRMKMSWDDKYFYVGAQMDEPHVWGTLTEHDAVIFHDNDFEVFIDPDGDTLAYGEFEINALNTGWDLFLPKPYRHGGKADNGWEIPGLKTAIHVDGTLNDPTDEDRGWSVELAFPWEVLSKLSPLPAPPADGDQWRINFSRVEWRHEIVDGKYRKVPDTKEDNWVWSPQGVIDMHRPETWGYVRFSGQVNHRGTEGTEKANDAESK